tara:strand:+ start:199 stop:663 length:465 start_codon:yes stop_codon:yes gene_type:complete
MGPIIGTIVKTIWIKSKKNPRTKIKIIRNNIAPVDPPGICFINEVKISLPSSPIKTKEKILALISIKNIIELIFVVSKTPVFRTFKEKLFLRILKSIAPTAPKDAASVGVAIPNRIDPRTKTIRIIGKKIILKVFVKVFFFFLIIIGGEYSGLK